MNVVTPQGHDPGGVPGAASSPAALSVLDRAALATGAAERRARAAAIETDIDHACEQAALAPKAPLAASEHRNWTQRAWRRHVAEAVRQANRHTVELETLRREAAQLDRLLQVSRFPDDRPAAGIIAPS